jgi:hypothetical protein
MPADLTDPVRNRGKVQKRKQHGGVLLATFLTDTLKTAGKNEMRTGGSRHGPAATTTDGAAITRVNLENQVWHGRVVLSWGRAGRTLSGDSPASTRAT